MTPADQVTAAIGCQLADAQRLVTLLQSGRRMDKVQVEALWRRVRAMEVEIAGAEAALSAVVELAEEVSQEHATIAPVAGPHARPPVSGIPRRDPPK